MNKLTNDMIQKADIHQRCEYMKEIIKGKRKYINTDRKVVEVSA